MGMSEVEARNPKIPPGLHAAVGSNTGYELVPTWHASITGGGLNHSATMLAPDGIFLCLAIEDILPTISLHI